MVRKRPAPEATEDSNSAATKKSCTLSSASTEDPTINISETKANATASSAPVLDAVEPPKAGLYCIGVLPGIGKYTESSDSEKSTDTDEDYEDASYDWVGRKVKNDHDHSKCGGSHWMCFPVIALRNLRYLLFKDLLLSFVLWTIEPQQLNLMKHKTLYIINQHLYALIKFGKPLSKHFHTCCFET